MKSFFQFLIEAGTATQQAARLGLVGDGHGGWYDKTSGEFVAKTEKGTLKFYNKRQKVGQQDPAQTEKEKNLSQGTDAAPAQQEPVQQQAPAPEQQPAAQEPQQPVATPPPVPKTKGTLTIAFGRFNPPTIGHQQLMDTAAAASQADGGDYVIYPSRSQDKKKNPLDPRYKDFIYEKNVPWT
jgi:hypothetical protein